MKILQIYQKHQDIHLIFLTIFDNEVQEEHDKMSEVDKYLDLCLTPSAHPARFGGKQGKMNF